MVAVQVRYGETFYVIGDFWQIVDRLKAHQAFFRFRARRWRWPEDLTVLQQTMFPFEVQAVSFSQAQQLQLQYDLTHIAPTQAWVKAHANLARLSVEWWEATRLKGKEDARHKKEFDTHAARVALALASVDLPSAELTREQIVALQQTQRTIEKYELRLVKWMGERAKIRRREELLDRFERELALSRANLIEIETTKGASRQALYEEVAGLDWRPTEISELKAAAKFLVGQTRKVRSS